MMKREVVQAGLRPRLRDGHDTGDSKWTIWLASVARVRQKWEKYVERLAVITVILDFQVPDFGRFKK